MIIKDIKLLNRYNSKKYLGFVLLILIVLFWTIYKFDVLAFNLFRSEAKNSDSDVLSVMTWNVHCSNGADKIRQKKIANLILLEDLDFILLNEYHQDSCSVIDSMLMVKYEYTEEFQSHKRSGDIFYSKRQMSNSGHQSLKDLECFRSKETTFPDSLKGKSIQTLKATIEMGKDSVQILGVHMMCNSCNGSAIIDGVDSLKKFDRFYEQYKNAQEHRNFQAKWSTEIIKESKHPVIVMGDFNDFSFSTPMDTFLSCGLKNGWLEGGFGYGCTFHAGWMRLRIDHILYNSDRLNLLNIRVIETDLSDHNPVIADFKLKN